VAMASSAALKAGACGLVFCMVWWLVCLCGGGGWFVFVVVVVVVVVGACGLFLGMCGVVVGLCVLGVGMLVIDGLWAHIERRRHPSLSCISKLEEIWIDRWIDGSVDRWIDQVWCVARTCLDSIRPVMWSRAGSG
jgi:hypothetical protein